MMKRSNGLILAVAALSAVVTRDVKVNADVIINGGEVNISGATLFRDFFKAPASTNDWIDADNDGFFGFNASTPPYVDQLAVGWADPMTTWWLVQYRAVGSGNGLSELVDFALCGTIPMTAVPDQSTINRYVWGPPGTTPYLPSSVDIGVLDVPVDWMVRAGDPAYQAWNRKPRQTGYGCNTTPSYGDACLGSGFDNSLKTLCRDCDDAGPQPEVCLNLNTALPNDKTVFNTEIAWVPISFIANRGVAMPDRDATDGKPGGDVRMSELQHLFVTGRMPNGENLVGATRDVGSGTRNGAMNSIGVDPSFGVGDNLHIELTSKGYANLGPYHQATTLGGSSIMEVAVQNRRLAVGYSGTAGSGAAADANAGYSEMLNVMKDIDGDGDGLPDGSLYVRPTKTAILDNANASTGWQVGGPETFATVGSPYGVSVAFDFDRDGDVDLVDFGQFQNCFNGPNRPAKANTVICRASDIDKDNDVDLVDFGSFQNCFNGPNRAPKCGSGAGMSNTHAAAYIRNIYESMLDFNGNPSSTKEYNMPGEFLASTYFLSAGVDAVPDRSNPARFIDHTATTDFNQTLQDYIRANNTLLEPVYGTKNAAGLVPTRRTLPDTPPPQAGTCPPSPTAYLDGTNGSLGYAYKDSAGTVRYITGAKKLSQRNAVQGDFNKDGARNLLDVCAMMQAAVNPLHFEQPSATYCTNRVPAGGWGGNVGEMAQDVVITHVIGDFNGDGNFDAADVRYFADGLAVDTATGKLNRKQAFIHVDTCWAGLPGGNGNYFGTTKARGTYTSGDSRGDVAGSTAGPRPGADPAGADGAVNAVDVNYVHANVVWALSKGVGDWTNLDQAVGVDLSCDMNGDLVVDCLDTAEIVTAILGTCLGDLDFDGRVTAAEVTAIQGNIGMANPTYTDGDLDCDGQVTSNDVAIATAQMSVCP